MVVKRHAAYATALHAWVWSVFLMKRTPIMSTKPVPVSSMPFQPRRTCLSLALMCRMPLPSPPLQNRGSSSNRTKPSVDGGLTKTTLPYQMDMSSLYFQQCRVMLEENAWANPDARIHPLTQVSINQVYQAESVGSNSLLSTLVCYSLLSNL